MKPPIAVYCDFDGTITQQDSIDFFLERLADPSWKEIEAQWEHGLIGSRECLAKQIPLIKGGWKAIEPVLDEVSLDPSFAPFAAWCSSKGIPLIIVSDGFEQVIKTLLKRDRISVNQIWANQLCESTEGELNLSFPYPPVDKNCRAGLCKCQVFGHSFFKTTKVMIGDGLNDLCWAENADLVFAKSKLLRYCQNKKIAHNPFDNFKSIQLSLEKLAKEISPMKSTIA